MPNPKIVTVLMSCEEIEITIGALENEIRRNPSKLLEQALASLQAKYQSEGCAKVKRS